MIMKAQIISVAIILITAFIFAGLGLFIYKEEKRFKNYFKWFKIKRK